MSGPGAFSVSVLGVKEMAKTITGLSKKIDANVAKAVRQGAIRIQKRAVERIQGGSKSGKIYEKYRPRRTHQASKAGESPASDQGRLASSIKIATDGKDVRSAFVYTTRAYGRHLEFGTKKSAKHAGIAARPWLFPSYEENRESIEVDLARAFTVSLP